MIDPAALSLHSTCAGGIGVTSTIDLRPARTAPPEHLGVNTPGVAGTRLGGVARQSGHHLTVSDSTGTKQ